MSTNTGLSTSVPWVITDHNLFKHHFDAPRNAPCVTQHLFNGVMFECCKEQDLACTRYHADMHCVSGIPLLWQNHTLSG